MSTILPMFFKALVNMPMPRSQTAATLRTLEALQRPATPTVGASSGSLPCFKHYTHPTRRLHEETKQHRVMAAKSRRINRLRSK